MEKLNIEQLIATFTKLKYPIKDGKYLMNTVGIRNKEVNTNTFNDLIGNFYKDENDQWVVQLFDGTTEPGAYWLHNPMQVTGTACMVPGFYKNCYILGQHKGYRALEQIAPMKYIRDGNRDTYLDYGLMQNPDNYIYDNIKSNIHRANPEFKSMVVEKWSAGCQVIADPKDYDKFLKPYKFGILNDWSPNLFSYALLREEELVL